jgi:hypothetical protein
VGSLCAKILFLQARPPTQAVFLFQQVIIEENNALSHVIQEEDRSARTYLFRIMPLNRVKFNKPLSEQEAVFCCHRKHQSGECHATQSL